MADLFLQSTAVLSDDGLHRLEIVRCWDKALPLLPVVMLNPSTADAVRNDPTALTVNHFAQLWSYGGWRGANLYSWRSPSPDEMKCAPGRSTAANQQALRDLIEYAASTRGTILCAWGNDGDFEGKGTEFATAAARRGCSLICLGITASGAPKHPLARGKHRIPRDQQPLPWTPRLRAA